MEKKVIAFTLLWCASYMASAQEGEHSQKLIKAYLTISPTYRLHQSRWYFYLHGNLEYYVSSKISIAGDAYYLAGPRIADAGLPLYQRGFLGPAFHRNRGKQDWYFSIQPGLGLTRIEAKQNVSPLFSVVAGENLFVGGIFHFFMQVRVAIGQSHYQQQTNLSDVTLSAGLGFNSIKKGNK